MTWVWKIIPWWVSGHVELKLFLNIFSKILYCSSLLEEDSKSYGSLSSASLITADAVFQIMVREVRCYCWTAENNGNSKAVISYRVPFYCRILLALSSYEFPSGDFRRRSISNENKSIQTKSWNVGSLNIVAGLLQTTTYYKLGSIRNPNPQQTWTFTYQQKIKQFESWMQVLVKRRIREVTYVLGITTKRGKRLIEFCKEYK